MAIKLHTCGQTWIHGGHPCWRVMKALDEAGIEYLQIKEPTIPGRRTSVRQQTGQLKLPFIEFDDRTVLREESADLAARIREGRLGDSAPSFV